MEIPTFDNLWDESFKGRVWLDSDKELVRKIVETFERGWKKEAEEQILALSKLIILNREKKATAELHEKLCKSLLVAMSGIGPTPAEGYGLDIQWAVLDSVRLFDEVRDKLLELDRLKKGN